MPHPHARIRLVPRLALALLLCAAGPAASRAEDPAEPDREAYLLHCSLCHGEDGTPVPTLEKVVEMQLPHLGSSDVQELSDDDIREIIQQGSGKMNPVISISESQIPGVIAFVRTLKLRDEKPDPAP